MNHYVKKSTDFVSHGVRCSGDLYLPTDQKHPPVVVMGHGFAAEKCFRLPAYAERFLEKGMAAFLFDYRCFGLSDGTPRHWVSPWRHVQDWHAALAHVRRLPDIDARKIGLWGSSFGGGHVVAVAAKDPNIRAVVAQVPYADPFSSLGGLGLKNTVMSIYAALRDGLRAITAREPYYIPVVGKSGDFAAIVSLGRQPTCFLPVIVVMRIWSNMQYYKYSLRMEQECEFRANYDKC
jgi:dienelactone hydrolase